VRQIDIFPTILEILNLSIPEKIDGKSLSSFMNDESVNDSFAFIESPPTVTQSSLKFIGIRDSQYKYIRSLDKEKNISELYDLVNDPLEEKNISSERPEIIKNMNKSLNELRNLNIKEHNFNEAEKEKVEKTLKKLGYI